MKEKASEVIRHFEKERVRLNAENTFPATRGPFNNNEFTQMLTDVKFELMGRHVLCEKDFTKIKNEDQWQRS